ncbi:MAG: CBS domain-containing protein, partial [Dehalococcoidia bacterium]
KAAVRLDTNLEVVETIMKNERLDALPVLSEGLIAGIIANLDIVQVPKAERVSKFAADVMSTNLIICYSSENLDVALERMSRNNISHLPVMDEDHPLRLIGMLCIEDVTNTYRAHASTLENANCK